MRMSGVTQHAPLAAILAGCCLLVLGRKLFWFFVGISGFLAGVFIVESLGLSQTATLVAGVVAGLAGAAIAVFLQKLAVGVAGFLAGAYLALNLANMGGWDRPPFLWVAVLVGGILGGALVAGLFDWALIILSSLLGASLIADAVHTPALLCLSIAGVLIQAGHLHRSRRRG